VNQLQKVLVKATLVKAACTAAICLAGLGVPFVAYAQHVGFAVVVPAPVYVPPPVVVVRPPVYVVPRPVYVSPPAIYVAPAPALVIGWHNNQYWDGHRNWGHDEYLQFHHHGDYHGYGHRPY